MPLKLQQRPTCSSGSGTDTASTLSPLTRPSPEGSVSEQRDSVPSRPTLQLPGERIRMRMRSGASGGNCLPWRCRLERHNPPGSRTPACRVLIVIRRRSVPALAFRGTGLQRAIIHTVGHRPSIRTAALLAELCVGPRVLPGTRQELELLVDPPRQPEEFIKEVLKAEGFDPALIDRRTRGSLEKLASDWLHGPKGQRSGLPLTAPTPRHPTHQTTTSASKPPSPNTQAASAATTSPEYSNGHSNASTGPSTPLRNGYGSPAADSG